MAGVDAVFAESLGVSGDGFHHPMPANHASPKPFDGVDTVGFMTDVVHREDRSCLDDYRSRIETMLDATVLETGRLLAEARDSVDFDTWFEWVDHELPFTPEKARQLVAIFEAFAELPEALLAQLPRPHHALFALSSLTQAELEDAMIRFELGETSTVEQTRLIARHYRGGVTRAPRAANIRASKLMERESSELDPMVRASLTRWLHS